MLGCTTWGCCSAFTPATFWQTLCLFRGIFPCVRVCVFASRPLENLVFWALGDISIAQLSVRCWGSLTVLAKCPLKTSRRMCSSPPLCSFKLPAARNLALAGLAAAPTNAVLLLPFSLDCSVHFNPFFHFDCKILGLGVFVLYLPDTTGSGPLQPCGGSGLARLKLNQIM